MKRFLVLAILALAFSRIPQNVKASTINFTVFLSGTNEAPPNSSSVVGQGWVTLDGNVINFAFGNFRYYPFYPTSAGIYGPARPGKNGPLIVGDLAWGISPPEGQVYDGGWELTRAQIGQLKAGLLYVSIKSVQFPDGEIRGQILPDRPEPPINDPGQVLPATLETGILKGPPPPHPAPPAGFYGQSLFFHSVGPSYPSQPPLEGLPYKTYVTVYNTSGQFVKRVLSNPAGQFYAYLKPGNYILLATPPGQEPPPHTLSEYSGPGSASGLPDAPLVNITVTPEKLTRADVTYSQVE